MAESVESSTGSLTALHEYMTNQTPIVAPIDTALLRIDEETHQTQAEYQAFETFAERVAALNPQPPLTGPHTHRVLHPSGSTTAPTNILTAYQETVMSVSHYETVYGDSLAESLTAELGSEIANDLATQTALSPTLQTAVCTAAHRAANDRTGWLEILATEQTALADAQTTLADLTERLNDVALSECRTVDDFSAVRDRLQCVDTRADQVARTRQRQIHDRTLPAHLDGHDIATYLYQEYDWTYPILTAVSRLVAHLQTTRATIERRLDETD